MLTRICNRAKTVLDYAGNAMAHAQKPDFVFRRNGRVHLKRRGRQFSRLLAAEVCASAVVMLDTPCSDAVWRVLATHFIRQFPLHFTSRASPCAITFQLDSTEFVLKNWTSLGWLRSCVFCGKQRFLRYSADACIEPDENNPPSYKLFDTLQNFQLTF